MAVAYLNDGATSLAAAYWSDATGFGAAAQLVINSGSQAIASGLSQTSSSIEYLDVLPGFTGVIGGSTGSLECDIDGTSESDTAIVSRLRYMAGGGAIYFKANGGNTLAHYVEIETGGRFYGTGGILKNVRLVRGEARFSDQVLATSGTWYFYGGSALVDYHASGAIPTLIVNGGSHILNRNATTLYVNGGEVTIDAQGLAITSLYILGSGRVRLINCGTITSLYAESGTLDLSQAGRPIVATTLYVGTCNIIRSRLFSYGTLKPLAPSATA